MTLPDRSRLSIRATMRSPILLAITSATRSRRCRAGWRARPGRMRAWSGCRGPGCDGEQRVHLEVAVADGTRSPAGNARRATAHTTPTAPAAPGCDQAGAAIHAIHVDGRATPNGGPGEPEDRHAARQLRRPLPRRAATRRRALPDRSRPARPARRPRLPPRSACVRPQRPLRLLAPRKAPWCARCPSSAAGRSDRCARGSRRSGQPRARSHDPAEQGPRTVRPGLIWLVGSGWASGRLADCPDRNAYADTEQTSAGITRGCRTNHSRIRCVNL